MRKSFVLLFAVILAAGSFYSCEKEEGAELTTKLISKDPTLEKGGTIGTSPPTGCPEGDPNSTFRLSPYVEQTDACYNLYHTGYNYETVVYAHKAKPYTRRVVVFGWRNGNRSSIPHSYSLTIPANAFSSNRVSTFYDEPAQYTSMLVEVSNVFKQVGSDWVIETDYKATCAEVPVQNCYHEDLPCHLTNTCDDDDDDNPEPPTIY